MYKKWDFAILCRPPFDEMRLKDYLLQEGFEKEMESISSAQVLIHGSFAHPSASLEDAREGWKEIFNVYSMAWQKRSSRSSRPFSGRNVTDRLASLKRIEKKHTASVLSCILALNVV